MEGVSVKHIAKFTAFAAFMLPFAAAEASAQLGPNMQVQVKARKKLCVEVISPVVRGPLFLSECNTESTAQVFRLEVKRGEVHFELGSGPNTLCVDAEYDFGPLILMDCKTKKRQWRVDQKASVVKAGNLCWAVPGGNFFEGMTLRAEPCKAGPSQQFDVK
jgi:hypothetical protein